MQLSNKCLLKTAPSKFQTLVVWFFFLANGSVQNSCTSIVYVATIRYTPAYRCSPRGRTSIDVLYTELARHLSDARASSVYCSYARLTIVSAEMHFIVSEYVYFVHVFYDNSVHVTCIDLRSNRSLAYSQSRGCAHNRYTPPYLMRDTSTFLDSVPRARGTCAHSSPLLAPYPRAEPSDSDSYPSHRRGHSHDSTPSSRENSRGTPIAISRAKCIIFVLRPRGTHT